MASATTHEEMAVLAAEVAAEVHRLEVQLLDARERLKFFKRRMRALRVGSLVRQYGGSLAEELDELKSSQEPDAACEPVQRNEKRPLVATQGPPAVAVERCKACRREEEGSWPPGVRHDRVGACRLAPDNKKKGRATASGSVASGLGGGAVEVKASGAELAAGGAVEVKASGEGLAVVTE